jgi:DNA topoisomerase I
MLNAAGIIFRSPQGRILLMRRKDGKWDYPGGGAEGDETAKQTALRETVEETKYYPGHVGRFHARRVRNGVDYTTFLRDCEDEFVPRLSSEHTDYIWIDPKRVLTQSVKAVADDAVWEESDHPRDEDGKFGSGGGSNHVGATRGEGGKLVGEGGGAVPEHIASLKVPPAWTDVTYAQDPGAALLVTGRDSKGRRVFIYSEMHAQKQAALKFARISELDQKFQAVAKQNAALAKTPEKRDVADCLGLVMAMGIRPGSDRDTKAAKKAYGATTLEGQHVVTEGDTTYLRYTGKKGVALNLPVPKAWAKAIQERADKAGPSGRLFGGVTDAMLRDHVHTLDGGGFKTKDFRTHLGTSTAAELVETMEVPKTQAEYRKAVMEVAKKVSTVLGNTPVIALQSYINPSVFGAWKAAA